MTNYDTNDYDFYNHLSVEVLSDLFNLLPPESGRAAIVTILFSLSPFSKLFFIQSIFKNIFTEPISRIIFNQPIFGYHPSSPISEIIFTQPILKMISTQPNSKMILTQSILNIFSLSPFLRLFSIGPF